MRTTLDSAIERVAAVNDADMKSFLQNAVVRMTRCYADVVAAAGAMEFRGIAAGDGYQEKHTARLLQELTRLSLNECRSIVKAARLTSRRATGGSSIADPQFPATAAALADGDLNSGHVREIITAMSIVPADWPDREGFETSLATLARSAFPEDVKLLGKKIADQIEQETPPPDDDDDRLAEPDRRLRITERLDGRIILSGSLDKETAVQLQAFLHAFAKPRKSETGERDTRSLERRQGDALAELIHHGVTCTGVLPNDTRPKVIFTLSWEDLQKDVSRILMTGYGVISPEAARRLLCDAEIIPVVLNGKSLALDVGSSSRTATKAIRRALILRDGGCAFPGCDRAAYWCDAHHVKGWEFGGKTKFENMVLLCLAHHQIVHHSQWSILMLDGIPHFVPPAYLDPTQTPIRHARYTMKC